MEVIKLRVDSWIIKWTNICVEWFMNFFADPEYYWVEETYPNSSSAAKREENGEVIIRSSQNEGLHLNKIRLSIDAMENISNKLIARVSSSNNLQLWVSSTFKSVLINGSRVFRPFQFVYIWDKLKYHVSNPI